MHEKAPNLPYRPSVDYFLQKKKKSSNQNKYVTYRKIKMHNQKRKILNTYNLISQEFVIVNTPGSR